jgi:hypothetical protein
MGPPMKNPQAGQSERLTPRYFSSCPGDARLHDNSFVRKVVKVVTPRESVRQIIVAPAFRNDALGQESINLRGVIS